MSIDRDNRVSSHQPVLDSSKQRGKGKRGKGRFYTEMQEYQDPHTGRVSKAAEGIPLRFETPTKPERLTASSTDRHLRVEDAGAWEVEMQCFHDKDSYLSKVAEKDPQKIKGIKASKAPAAHLTELTAQVYAKRGKAKISKDTPKKEHLFNAHSATNHYDLVARPRLSEDLAKRLGFRKGSEFESLQTQHIVLKNGLNGASYKAVDGSTVKIEHAVAGSWDRESPSLQMGRRIAPLVDGEARPEAPSYCYTGRPETYEKALEQGKMIFFAEMASTQKKGISKKKDSTGETVYTLEYVINSMQSASPILKPAKLFGAEQEQDYLEQEKASLEKLRKGIRTITDPTTGKKYKVRFKPILFCRQVNVFSSLEKVLDSETVGSAQSIEETRKGWNELKQIARQYRKKLNPKEQELVDYLVNKLEHSINGRIVGEQMDATEEFACRAMLCILLDLPTVYHCKSSTDRTAIAVALQVALGQWMKQKLPIPTQFEKLLDNEYFKELFALNLVQGHQLTRHARGPEGLLTIDGLIKELDHETLGLNFGKGISEIVMLRRLLPKRYLKSYGLLGFLKSPTNWLKWLAIVLIGIPTIFFSTLYNPWGTLKAPKSLAARVILHIPMAAAMLIWRYFSLIFLFYRAIPSEVVNLEAMGVGERRLAKDARKHQKLFNKPLEAVPANAETLADRVHWNENLKGYFSRRRELSDIWGLSAKQIYNKLFRQRFCQNDRPIRHFLKGEVIQHAAENFQSKGKINKRKLLDQMRKDAAAGHKWRIDRRNYDDPKEVYKYLKTKLGKEKALEVMCSMQSGILTYSTKYLQKTLAISGQKIEVEAASNGKRVIYRLDTRHLRLTVEHDTAVKDGTTDTDHAIIQGKMVLNCDHDSDEFGQGYVRYALKDQQFEDFT